MRTTASIALHASLVLCTSLLSAHAGPSLRPPSVPLVACDPYFSIWSPADSLADADTLHWTGKPHRLSSTITIDGASFRLMGKATPGEAALQQTGLQVLPTRTIYSFEGQGVRATLTFMTAALPDDLMIYSRPVTYVTWSMQSSDKRKHKVAIVFRASGEIVVNKPDQPVEFSLAGSPEAAGIRLGSVDQPVLAKKGDDLRIDWGHLYLQAPSQGEVWVEVAGQKSRVPEAGQKSDPHPASEIVAACLLDCGEVATHPVSRWIMLAYDDEYSIQYFKKNLRPYWRRNGDDAAALLKKAAADYESLVRRCEKFDAEMMADLRRIGGENYARICALAYRQCVAANKVVADAKGQPLMFPKENFSNGCIGTVDVIYPMAPQFLLFSPSLTKAMLVPILDYAASPRWRWPFAPHDLGTYPLANGQVYGGGERTERDQMPVEETGNMLIMLAALAQMEGNANFCAKYWPVLEKWSDYLKDKGFDPENQLCTDDFAGHLAHNVNLSAKAICGLASFSKLAAMRGEKAKAKEFMDVAQQFAQRWVKEADDGEKFRLAFDRPGTWSQKYNLVWDRILGFNLFPPAVARKEMDFYRKTQNKYGLPLDNRKPYTKLDWTLWTATLTQNRADFKALVDPVFLFLNETSNRVPMTDWFMTTDAKQRGFQARSVVGGVFLQALYNRPLWHKWAARDRTKAGNWAPLPEPPKVTTLLPAADTSPASWRYAINPPPDGWQAPGFDDSAWNTGHSGFGTTGTPGAIIGTTWNTGDIWLRREVVLQNINSGQILGWLHHDEDAEIYLNGVLALRAPGFSTQYETVPLLSAGQRALKPGSNLIAVHCHQTAGGQYIDLGLVTMKDQ